MKSEKLKGNFNIIIFYFKTIFCIKNLILFISSFLLLMTFYFNIKTLATFADRNNEDNFILVRDKWMYVILLLNIWFTLFFTYTYIFLEKLNLFKEKKNLKTFVISSIFIIFNLILLSAMLISFKGFYNNDSQFKEVILIWIFSILFSITSLLIISFFKFKQIKVYYLIIAFLIISGFIFMVSILCISPGMSKDEFLIFEKNSIISLSSIIIFVVFLKEILILSKNRKIK